MTLHLLEPREGTLHGTYSRDFAPVLTIDSGDAVRFRTLEAGWNVEPWDLECKPVRKFEPRTRERDWGHRPDRPRGGPGR